MVVPYFEKEATWAAAQRITTESGCNRKLPIMPETEEEVVMRDPSRLTGAELRFLSSTYSASGKPTAGDGSAMISWITTSYRCGCCAAMPRGKSRTKVLKSHIFQI